MDKEELRVFLDGLKYRIDGVLQDIARFERELEKE